MAPKAAPKTAPKAAPKPAAAKAAPKAKAEKEKKPEEEIPKVAQPDRAACDEKLNAVQEAINKLQEEQKALTNEINSKSGGRDEFQEEKAALRVELDACSKEMDRLMEAKNEINASIGQNQQEGRQMRDQLNKMKKSIGFTSEAEIDERIASIEFKMWTDSISLREEKKYMAELQELKRNRPKVSQLHNMEENLQNRDSGLPLKERVKGINEEMAIWREKKKAVQEKMSVLTEGRKEKLGDVPQLREKRDALGAQIKEKIAERNTIRDEFREEERKYRDYLGEVRRLRAEKAAEERNARQKEYEQRRLIREAEKLDEQPYVAEITLVEQTIAFCKNLTQPKEAKQEAAKKDIAFNNPDGSEVLVSKKDRDEEFYFAPTARGKKGKSANKAKPETTGTKPIKHNAETFQLFDKLKLDAPITTDDIPPLLEKLEEKLTYYNEKVKEWEEKRDEMKRIILEGGTLPEEEKEEKEDDAEEEDKAEPEAKAEEEEAED